MKNIEALARKIFFYGALVVAALGVGQKIANIFGYTLWRQIPEISRLIEIAAIACCSRSPCSCTRSGCFRVRK